MPVYDADDKLQRLLTLQLLFWRNPERGFRTAEIAEHLGISDRAVRNYLDEMSTSGRLPIYKEGWEWHLVEGARMELLPVTFDLAEGALLYTAARLLARHTAEPHPALRPALTKLVSALPETLSPYLEQLIRTLPVARSHDYAVVFEALVYGWATRRVVELTYNPLKTGRPFQAQFHPYLLEPSAIGYTVYAIGYSTPPCALRTFKLERIECATLTSEQFELPDNFDGLALLRQAWGVMYGEAPQTVRLRFSSGKAARRVRETMWHPSQRFIDEDNGAVIWEADVGDWLELLPWVRGWGSDCQVLAPETLRLELVAEARRMAQLYGWEVHRAKDTHQEEEHKESDGQVEQADMKHRFFDDFFGGR